MKGFSVGKMLFLFGNMYVLDKFLSYKDVFFGKLNKDFRVFVVMFFVVNVLE